MKTFAFILATIISSALTAQIVFERTYGGPMDEMGTYIRQTTDGGYIIGGVVSDSTGMSDYLLIKINSVGDTSWTKVYHILDYDDCYSVEQTSDGGYIFSGESSSNGEIHLVLIKTDSNGNVSWQKLYAGSRTSNVEETSDGGYIVAGSWSDSVADDVYLLKVNVSGDSVWAKTFGGSEDETAYSVRQTSDGGYILAGYTYSLGAGESDAYLLKTNSSGDSLWAKTFGGEAYDYGYVAEETFDGGYIMVGDTGDFADEEVDIYLIKTDANGNTTWVTTIGGHGQDFANFVQQTSDSSYIIAGVTTGNGYDAYLIKVDVNGNIVWEKTFGDHEEQGFACVQPASDGFAAVGYSYAGLSQLEDVYLVKTDDNGELISGTRELSNIACNIKAYPNPSDGNVTIAIEHISGDPDAVSVTIFDALGRQTLLYPQILSSRAEIRLEAGDFPSGLYYFNVLRDHQKMGGGKFLVVR